MWELVKPTVREIQNDNAVLIIDGSIEEKLYTDESELNCWHRDHCFNRNVKGIHFVTCLYRSGKMALSASFQIIQKTEWETDKKSGKQKQKCPKIKNEYIREMVAQSQTNQIPFKHVFADVWFSSAESMIYLKKEGCECCSSAALSRPPRPST